VVLSSHLMADVERVCDYLIVLVGSRVQLTGPAGELLAGYRLRQDPGAPPASLEDMVLATMRHAAGNGDSQLEAQR